MTALTLEQITENVARAWASIDGKAEQFDACKADPAIEQVEGHFEGYLSDAHELLNRSGVLSALSEATSERDAANVYKAKAISRGKLLERFRDHVQEICDHATDEGDRVYFGSTNDLDELRAIAREMEDWKWDAIMRERPESDPYALCRELRTRAETAERKLAEVEQDYEIAAHERDALTSEVAELQRKLAEAVEALRPFSEAARNFSFAIGPDGVDDGLTVIAHVHARPECEATLSTSDFSSAAKIVGEQP